MKWLMLGIALGMLGTLKWAEASELYRCPGNLYTDKPGAKCVRVEQRISIIPSPHAQHVGEREMIATDVARQPSPKVDESTTLPPRSVAPDEALDLTAE